jgi:hypothetical protein
MMKNMGVDLLVLNEVKRRSGIISTLRDLGYATAYNDPEFLIAWLPASFEFVNERDMVLSEHDYWLSRNEGLSVTLRHKKADRKVRVIDEHPPAHISRPNHPTFPNVLEVHKDVAAKNERMSKRSDETGVPVLIMRDSNIDPLKDRPVYQDSWKWAYRGYKYVRSPEPTFGSRRHIDEALIHGLHARRPLG